MPDDLDGCPTRVVGRTPAMFHNTLVVGSSIRKPRKSGKTVKTPGDLDRCPTKGAGRTPTMFHNTLVVGSSPTSSTTHSGATGDSPFVEMSKKRGSSVVSASAFQRWAGSRFLCVPAAIDKGQPSAELAKYSAI